MNDGDLNDEDLGSHFPNLSVLKDIFVNSRYNKIDRRYFDALIDDDLAKDILVSGLDPRNYDEFYQRYDTQLWFEEADLMFKLSRERFEDHFIINGPNIGLKFARIFSYIPNFSLILGGQVAVCVQAKSDRWARQENLVFDVIDTSETMSKNLIQLSPVRGQQYYSSQQLKNMTIKQAYLIPCHELFERCHETLQKIKDNDAHILRRVLTAIFSNQSDAMLEDYDRKLPLIDIGTTDDGELLSALNTLDVDQRNAVADILAAKFRPYPFVIGGVPGSGKTETLIEAMYQVYKRSNGTMRILVCTTSENYLQMLYERIISDRRINESVIEYAISEQRWRSSITTIVDKSIHLATTLESASFADNYFDYIFFDKAPGAHQPETLIVWSKLKIQGCFVMSGDFLQQYTRLQNGRIRAIGKDESMLQLFSQREPGAGHDRRYATYLARSYRCDPRLLLWANQERYNERILLGNLRTPRSILQQLGFSSPVVLVDVRNRNMIRDTRTQNKLLAQTCSRYVKELNESQISPNDIGVVAMTRRVFLRELLRRHLRKEFNERIVDSDSEFLGVEKKAIVIVLDSTRNRDPSQTKYIFGGRRRLTMAMTRAKWIVIIIGDFTELDANVTWNNISESACTIRLDP